MHSVLLSYKAAPYFGEYFCKIIFVRYRFSNVELKWTAAENKCCRYNCWCCNYLTKLIWEKIMCTNGFLDSKNSAGLPIIIVPEPRPGVLPSPPLTGPSSSPGFCLPFSPLNQCWSTFSCPLKQGNNRYMIQLNFRQRIILVNNFTASKLFCSILFTILLLQFVYENNEQTKMLLQKCVL